MIDLLLVLLLVALALGVIGAIALAARSKSEFTQGNQVVPGGKSPAPAAWAGAHSPEARLHRRLRDAVTAMRTADADGVSALRSQLEQAALALDDRLVAVAALPERTRGGPLADVDAAVAALEDAASTLALGGRTAGQLSPGVVDEVTQHLRVLVEAQQELEQLPIDLPDQQRGAQG